MSWVRFPSPAPPGNPLLIDVSCISAGLAPAIFMLHMFFLQHECDMPIGCRLPVCNLTPNNDPSGPPSHPCPTTRVDRPTHQRRPLRVLASPWRDLQQLAERRPSRVEKQDQVGKVRIAPDLDLRLIAALALPGGDDCQLSTCARSTSTPGPGAFFHFKAAVATGGKRDKPTSSSSH
jgi:hypothetical protein